MGGLTGGVYKAREHIHRGVADPRLLAIPAVMEASFSLQSELEPAFWDFFHLAASAPFVPAIVARLQPGA